MGRGWKKKEHFFFACAQHDSMDVNTAWILYFLQKVCTFQSEEIVWMGHWCSTRRTVSVAFPTGALLPHCLCCVISVCTLVQYVQLQCCFVAHSLWLKGCSGLLTLSEAERLKKKKNHRFIAHIWACVHSGQHRNRVLLMVVLFEFCLVLPVALPHLRLRPSTCVSLSPSSPHRKTHPFFTVCSTSCPQCELCICLATLFKTELSESFFFNLDFNLEVVLLLILAFFFFFFDYLTRRRQYLRVCWYHQTMLFKWSCNFAWWLLPVLMGAIRHWFQTVTTTHEEIVTW